ncbi:50S ribosomal protein L4 [Rubrivirga litoralis]|uniref:Large ribosomal subunit protein uL4 n=1 Tax=Rubrivirga litoralis TaxID=3075598 RepID=A0ABU3BRZ1_9BACT|nr:50S ribosomal protein L4 [Rubrivirga sp. F394]MDT0632051.1 50S ribosomal protein L4 [Rubrivirga sp. F394]
MKLSVYTRAGAEAGRQVELDDAIFGIEPNDHAIWLDVRSIQANKRQGTHKTKERSEVSKSRRKLYRQKGTGNARAGDAKSPLRKGGGTIFGPRPHEYTVRVNRKTKQLARRSALAYKLTDSTLRVIEDIDLAVPKTREIADLLKSNGVSGKTLVLSSGLDNTLYRSARNIPGVKVLAADQASTLDLIGAKTILLQEGAVEALTEALRPAQKATVDGQSAPPETARSKAAASPATEGGVEETDLPVPMEDAPTTADPAAPDVPTTPPAAEGGAETDSDDDTQTEA